MGLGFAVGDLDRVSSTRIRLGPNAPVHVSAERSGRQISTAFRSGLGGGSRSGRLKASRSCDTLVAGVFSPKAPPLAAQEPQRQQRQRHVGYNFAGGWVIRGELGVVIPNNGSGDNLISQRDIGQTLTDPDVPLFGDFTYYLSTVVNTPSPALTTPAWR
jgi:hypothetical protein